MAEATVLVCDVCGKPEATTVTIRVGDRNLQKDYCPKHLAELVKGARSPKRGRRRGSTNSATRRKPVTRKTTGRRKAATRKRSTAKR